MNIIQIGSDNLFNIFNNCKLYDVLQLFQTCKYFKKIINEQYQHIKIFLDNWRQVKLHCKTLTEILDDLRNGLSDYHRVRINFLEESINQLNDVFNESINSININSSKGFWDCYCMIILRISITLLMAAEYFDEVKNGKLRISVNSDIYDLILVRYIHQIRCMIKYIDDPSAVIEDEEGRTFWKSKFGNRYYITYKEFQTAAKTVLECYEKDSELALWACIKFMINFPKDDIITPYKFHLLICHFGPLSELVNNILTYCIKGGGFVGYVNMYGARDILLGKSNDYFLIRFSRKEPTNLTITYNCSSNTRKPHQISLKKFLEQHNFRKPIPDKIALKELKKMTLNDYACNNYHYIVT